MHPRAENVGVQPLPLVEPSVFTADDASGDELAAAYLARAARRFASHDAAAQGYLMEMARTLRIETLRRRAHAIVPAG